MKKTLLFSSLIILFSNVSNACYQEYSPWEKRTSITDNANFYANEWFASDDIPEDSFSKLGTCVLGNLNYSYGTNASFEEKLIEMTNLGNEIPVIVEKDREKVLIFSQQIPLTSNNCSSIVDNNREYAKQKFTEATKRGFEFKYGYSNKQDSYLYYIKSPAGVNPYTPSYYDRKAPAGFAIKKSKETQRTYILQKLDDRMMFCVLK
ncbi:MAG: hypothetical protein L6Q33_03320 [Bacteriovoracaceae bacterium]|nr:hypothetical protein [Bacteriovoracaceae bacterium]